MYVYCYMVPLSWGEGRGGGIIFRSKKLKFRKKVGGEVKIWWKKIAKMEKICRVGRKVAPQIFSAYVPQIFS